MSGKESLKFEGSNDKIDQDSLALLHKRAAYADEAGKIMSKASPQSSFYKPGGESKILRNIIKSNKQGLLRDSRIRAHI
jgi:Chorismate mutase